MLPAPHQILSTASTDSKISTACRALAESSRRFSTLPRRMRVDLDHAGLRRPKSWPIVMVAPAPSRRNLLFHLEVPARACGCTANNESSVSHIDDECHQREGAAVQPMVAALSVRGNGKGVNGAPTRGWRAGPRSLKAAPFCCGGRCAFFLDTISCIIPPSAVVRATPTDGN